MELEQMTVAFVLYDFGRDKVLCAREELTLVEAKTRNDDLRMKGRSSRWVTVEPKRAASA